MDRRQALGILAALPLSSACKNAPSAGVPGGGASAPLADIAREYEAEMAEHGLAEWSRYAGVGSAEGAPEKMSALRARERATVQRAAVVCRERASEIDPREAERWTRSADGLALLDDPEAVALADQLEAILNDFPLERDGKRVSYGELRKLARSENADDRRASRRVLGTLHREAAKVARPLLVRRQKVAALRGTTGGYYDALLALRGVTARHLEVLWQVEQRTATAFRAAREEAKKRAGMTRIAPWDLELAVKKLGDAPDDSFPAEGAIPLARAFFAALGVSLDQPKVRIDVRDFAFGGQTISVHVPDDVRTVVRPTPGAGFYSTFLHELGHAFASTRNRESNPVFKSYEWVPGMSEPAYEEGVAQIFGLALQEAPVLGAVLPSLSQKDREAYSAHARRAELFGLRQRLAFLELERAALADPAQDLDALERSIAVKLLGVEGGEDAEPVWATSPFLATYPVYAQSYPLANVLSAQVRATLRRMFGEMWLTAAAGDHLREKLVFDGARTTMDEKLVRATGAPLGPDAYVAYITG
jgi:hypothetical protein